MIETPRIVILESQMTAMISQVIARSKIQQEIGKALGELHATIKIQGLAVIGPWFMHHVKPPGENFHLEICLPVSEMVKPDGRVQPGVWPGMTVARTTYHGGYEGLSQAWGKFRGWIETHGHNVTKELWERYLVGPESGGDASAWQTELSLQLVTSDVEKAS